MSFGLTRIGSYDFYPYNIYGELPEYPGIYVVSNGNYIVYVGKTNNLKDRFSKHEKWSCFMKHNANIVYLTLCANEYEQSRIEAELIYQFDPPCNKQIPTPW